MPPTPHIVVIISANTEWQIIKNHYQQSTGQPSPLGEWFLQSINLAGQAEPVIFFHGGWGKISAAATAQYVIDRWQPDLLVNLGTCGGFRGQTEKGEILLVERTMVYDIFEQIGDPITSLAHYTTELDLSWLAEPYPHPVTRTHIISADRDIMSADIAWLRRDFNASAADWESAAIAFVAKQNRVRCLILRGVSDLVDAEEGEAYDGNRDVFVAGARQIMTHLAEALPHWLSLAKQK